VIAAVNFSALIAQIRDNQFTPSQMEDMVYAMHSAYVDFHWAVNAQIPTNLEDVADTMVVARKNTESFDWDAEEEATLPHCDEVALRSRYASRLESMRGEA
jgi:hypothetical protein